MYAPILEIDTQKVTENARKLHDFCAARGVELAFATKGFSVRPERIDSLLELLRRNQVPPVALRDVIDDWL